MDQQLPQAQLIDNRPRSADVESLGLQMEAGWRFDFGAARLEPLVSLSHVTAEIEDTSVPAPDVTAPGLLLQYEDTSSQRLGIGLRGSAERSVGNVRLGFSLTGRVFSELDGESRARLFTTGDEDPTLADDFDGTFSEVVGGLTLTNRTGRVSGVLNVGSQFGDDYDALSASASFRYQW
jgi:outer membrane autotransporter protein